MSDQLKHECGVALLRLRKPKEHYARMYGTEHYGFQKSALLLEKQHNRGQDGAGLACLHLHPQPGRPCYDLEEPCGTRPLAELLEQCGRRIAAKPDVFSGNVFLGHLRYATFGRHDIHACHPFIRESSFLNRILMLAGNFNLTDTKDIFRNLVRSGHHPAGDSDGYLILQLLTHYLEQELARFGECRNFAKILRETASNFDGAFTFCGMTGDGLAFALRDAHGIRPGYFYFNDEVAVVASERPAIQAAFNCTTAEVQELPPGKAILMHPNGDVEFADCLPPKEKRSCVFERIYFSRANDAEIHQERKKLGHALIPRILQAIDGDLKNAFFSYIPNSAQVCFHGMLETLGEISLQAGEKIRFGQVAVKDAKFRTFIADAACRKDFYMHIYDVTYGLVRPGSDVLVVLDDSIVRGNTMRNAILPILDRLNPKKIVVASSAPPIRYPDCYGIDMATLHELVAFRALIDILQEHDDMEFLETCYREAKRQLSLPADEQTNCLKKLYERCTDEELETAIAKRLKPKDMRAEFQVVFQTCRDLRRSCPNHTGDWYFTGNYPTPGGFRVVNQALVNYVERNYERAY